MRNNRTDDVIWNIDDGHIMRRISRNALYMISGQIISKLSGFLFMLALARFLTVADFGDLNLVLSFVLITVIAVDCGLPRLIMRDLARDDRMLSRYLGVLLPWMAATSVMGYATLLAMIWASGYSSHLVLLTAVAGLGLLPLNLAAVFDAVLHARQRMQFSSLCGIVLSLTQTLAGLTALILYADLKLVLATTVFANLVYLFCLAQGAWSRGYRFTLQVDHPFAIGMLRSSFPYAGIAILSILSLRAEFLILGWFGGSSDVGIYSAAARFLEAAVVFPLMLASATAPMMSKFHVESPDKLRTIFLWTNRLLLSIILPGAISMVVLSRPIMNTLFLPQYSAAIPLLQIMFCAFPFAALELINTAVLVTSDYPKRTMLVFLATTCVRSALGLILIPSYGVLGSAAALLAAHVVAFAISLWCVRKWFLRDLHLLTNLRQPIIAGVGMGLVLLACYSTLGYWALFPAFAVYVLTLVLLAVQLPTTAEAAPSKNG